MKVFISYSREDQSFSELIANSIRAANIDVWMDYFELRPGENLFLSIQEGFRECDFIIPILSRSYVSSRWAMQMLSAFFVRELSQETPRIVPVLQEDCVIPMFLRDKGYVDFRTDFKSAAQRLVDFLRFGNGNKLFETDSVDGAAHEKPFLQKIHITELQRHLRNGDLTLVCGAGVSVESGVPAWTKLLAELLTNLFGKSLPDVTFSSKQEFAAIYQDYFNRSPLVVAQYLKNGLGDDFLPAVRRALYRSSPTTGATVEAIAHLCCSQDSGFSLSSIISFNFDDLIEYTLGKHHIKHRVICPDGQRACHSELSIYHVHGYLPREGEITAHHGIVFSEDTYHSQFIDPYSWSNLVQLNHYQQKVCVFLGLSMTDPNLRRLLDLAMRTNPWRTPSHYVFRRKYDPELVQPKVSDLKFGTPCNISDFVRVCEMLEQQDDTNLGLNTIWVDDYCEIPQVLKAVADCA